MRTGRLVPWQAPVYEFLTSVNVAGGFLAIVLFGVSSVQGIAKGD